jgi:hypothetical protein
VRDEQAFDAMRRYLLERYRNADVARSYAAGGAVFDCIRRGGAPTAAAAAASPCPDGTVPVRRITLAQLVRFATLRSFMDKGPGTATEPPP